jgi:glycosyltransferase involved in cell wall biosynthesis
VPTSGGLWRLVKLINKLQPDLIQGWMYHGNIAAQIANLLSSHKVPVCWSVHHSVNSLAAEKITVATVIKYTTLVSRYVDAVVFSSQNSKKQHENLGYYPNNTYLIHDSFDTSLFKPLPDAPLKVRQELNLPEDTILIGAIARYHPMKDQANFVKAAALLIKDYPNIHFLMVGPQVSRDNPILSSQIDKLNLTNQIHLLGERYDIPILAAALDIFTSSSAFGEAFPNVVGEAMSCEVPCVVTDVGDSAFIVGDTGKVIQPKDSQALANAWKEIIALDLDERKSLGKKARERIMKYFSLESENSAVAQYEKLYKTIIN